MAATKYDFDIEKGSSFRISIVYKDSEGTPVDLTDWCARLVWKTNLNVVQSFSTENLDLNLYKFFIDGPNAKITLMIPAHTANSFTFKTAKYDLELQSPDDLYAGGGKFTTRILFGVINLVQRYSGTENSLDCQNE
jgi:hypothetical protein